MTLAEMKQRMPLSELATWAAYTEENGPLNVALRIDAAVARAVAPFLEKAGPSDLMPWPKQTEPDEPATPEQVFELLAGISRKED